MAEWISVKDRLPEKEENYICFYIDFWGDKSIGIYGFSLDLSKKCGIKKLKKRKGFVTYLGDGDYYVAETVTHWMPLPEPPKGE